MSSMRGVDPFPELWERRTTLADPEGETWEVMSIEDLVRAKKTQRDKDWPMIRALVEAHFARHHGQPQPNDVQFWLRERGPRRSSANAPRRSPTCAAPSPRTARLLTLLTTAAEDDLPLERALMEEELAERLRDREYWRPSGAELERLRHQRN